MEIYERTESGSEQVALVRMPSDIILELKGITKSFPGVLALDNVDLSCREGEVHALVGENGAGKSTLIKILSGAHLTDRGDIYIRGQLVRILSPQDSFLHKIGIIYQELNLSPYQTVEQNILLGIEPTKSGGFLNNKLIRKRARATLRDMLKSNLELSAIVGELSVAEQQLVAIAKALQHSPSILIMDEPTSSLSDRERETLFNLMLDLKSKGMTFIYITHELKELFQISDRISVLKDGKMVGCRDTAKLTEDQVISMMVGRKFTDKYPVKEENVQVGEEILRVQNLSKKAVYENISFTLRRGEILGLTGLVGSGKTEIAKTVFGVLHPDQGEILLRHQYERIRSPQHAKHLGVGMVPEDRKKEGLSLILSVSQNLSMSILRRLSRLGFVKKIAEKKKLRLPFRISIYVLPRPLLKPNTFPEETSKS